MRKRTANKWTEIQNACITFVLLINTYYLVSLELPDDYHHHQQFVLFHIFHHKQLESGNECNTFGFHCIITLDNIFFLAMATHFNAGPNYLDGSQLSHGYW